MEGDGGRPRDLFPSLAVQGAANQVPSKFSCDNRISRHCARRRLLTSSSRHSLHLIMCISLLAVVKADHQSAPYFVNQPSFAGGLVTENQSKILRCQAIGFPEPQFLWYKDGRPLREQASADSLLRISPVRREDGGRYWCAARNAAGAVLSQKTTLTVAYMDSPASVDDTFLRVKDGDAAILEPPTVRSIPPVSVTWRRIGTGLLVPGVRHALSLDNELVLLASDQDDEGQYQASVTNLQAGTEATGGLVHLSIAGERRDFVSPEIILPPKDSIFKPGIYPASLECIVNARPIESVQIVWRKDDTEVALSGLPHVFGPLNRTLTLLDVTPAHEGFYECEASLSEHFVRASATVTVIVIPTITTKLPRETVSETGRILQLPCEAAGNPIPSIAWHHNAQPIGNGTSDARQVLSNGTLQISALSAADAGVYQCTAANDGDEASISTWLHVKSSGPEFVRPPSNVTVLYGKDALIACEVFGAPAPNITWYFDDDKTVRNVGRIQILESGSLLVASAESKDSGKYTCVRANSVGRVKGSAYLSVLVRTQIVQPPVDTRVILSSTAELQCKVTHDAAVPFSLTWHFQGQEVAASAGGRRQVMPDGTLHIGQARNMDVGTYTCRVTSEGGNETRSARLDVIELPYPPNSVKAVMLDTFPKTVNISWSKAFDGNSPISNYVVQTRVVPTTAADADEMEYLLPWTTARANISADQRSIVLSGLKPASSYEFRVSATNGVGEGNPQSAAEILHLPPEPPSGPPQGVVGGARSSTSIMVQWQNPSEEDRNGLLVGFSIRYKLAGYSASPWAHLEVGSEAQHSLLLQDLIVWQNYEIQVAARNEKGVGVYSPSVYIRTREGVPQASPVDVRVRALNSTSIQVWWRPPDPQLINGINQGYKLQAWLSEPSATNATPSRTVLIAPSPLDPFSEQDGIIAGLGKYVTYHVTVLCFTSPGDGPTSNPATVTTDEDVPDQVQSLKFEEILDTTILVVWSPPEHSNGILKGYTLKYNVKDVLETMVIRNLSADATRVKVTDLRPITAYTFEIFASTVVGPGPLKTATIQSGIPPVLPGPPAKLAVSNIGAFSVVLQFTPGFDGNTSVTRWSVEAQTRRNESWLSVYEVSDPEASNIEVGNLLPFTVYRLRLIANNVVGSSIPSEPSKFFQTIQAPPSHPPYNVTVRAVNANALRVRWTPLQQVEWYGMPRGYNIQYRPIYADPSTELNQYVILEDHNANSYVIKDLEEFTDYEISVQAFNDVGSSMRSRPAARERTREAVPSAGPAEVRVEATSSTTIVVKWGEVPRIHQNGIIEGYKVFYGAKNVPSRFKTIDGNATFTTTLTELRKYTLYSVQVLAFSRIGDGVLSNPPTSARTFEDVPGVPSNISFPDVSTTTARVLWDVPEEPNGLVLAYRVSYRLEHSSEDLQVRELVPSERTWKAVELQPETYYTFSLTARTNEGWGKTAHVKVYTTNNRESPQPPSTPQISGSQVQARQITFSWTPGRDGFAPLRSYTVQMAGGQDNPWHSIGTKVDPALTRFTVMGLRPHTPYKFRIQATNDIGSSGWSQESNLTWTFPASPERSPRQVTATPYTTTSVRVMWEPLGPEDWNGDVRSSGYRIEYCQVQAYSIVRPSDCPAERIQGANSSVLSLHQLERDRVYEIRVYGYNSRGDGPASNPVQVFVGEAVPTGEPREVRVEASGSTELKVSWKPPPAAMQNGDLLGYKIFYEPRSNDRIEEMEAVPPETMSYVLLDLKKFTEYSIQVLAFNPAGDGPRSAPQVSMTMEDVPGPPGVLVFVDVTMTSLNVTWSPPAEPNGAIASYLVTYETALPDIDFSKQVKQKVASPFLSVHGLAEAVTYTFHVRAETFDYGPESVGNITTGPQEGSPSSPEELSLKHSLSSLTFHWKNGPQGASAITGYLVEHREEGASEWRPLVQLSSGPQTSHTVGFRGLQPSTAYHFRLFARNSYGISFPSLAPQPFATPSKLLMESRHRLPVYREVWFLVMLASVCLVIIILVIAVLCVKSKVYKYKQEAQKSLHDDRMSIDDGGFATFELKQSKRGTLCKNSLARKNNNAIITKSPPRPSPGSVTYSDDDDTKGYDENCDSSSLTEKPSEISSSEQGSDSEQEGNGAYDAHSFVNHYANVNDTLRQSWKRQRPVLKPPSYTDSEHEGSVQVSLNGGHIVMNNMAGSRAPLPGFSSFV